MWTLCSEIRKEPCKFWIGPNITCIHNLFITSTATASGSYINLNPTITKFLILGKVACSSTFIQINREAASGGILQQKVFWEISQNSQKNTCARVSFEIKLQTSACNFIEKETPAQVFSCEFCEISKNTCFTENLWATTFVNREKMLIKDLNGLQPTLALPRQDTTTWKVSILGVFLVRIFPHSDWIRSDSPYLSIFIPNAGKNETKKRLKRKSSIKS